MGFWLPESIAFSWGNEIMFNGVCACVCVYEYFTLMYAKRPTRIWSPRDNKVL